MLSPSGSCYDAETTDADVKHAQIVQFATVQTDRNLNEASRHEILVRRLPYILPSREALNVIGLSGTQLDDPSRISEYDASLKIERLIKAQYGSPKIFLTFNGIHFDDELIRTVMFRNLRNPYVTSGKDTFRVDVLNLVRVAVSAIPGIINVPVKDDGSNNWKLEALAPANGIEIVAHDALGDCVATLDLAKVIKTKAEWLWKQVVTAGNAKKVEARLASAQREGRTVWLYTHFGAPDLAPCKVLTTNGQRRWFLADARRDDLPTDPETAESLLFTKDTPIHSIRASAAPFIFEDSEAHRILGGLDRGKLAEREWDIKGIDDVRQSVAEAIVNRTYETPPNQTSEERIYNGFSSDADKARTRLFHDADTWSERAKIRFDDDRLADFAGRLVVLAHDEGHAVSAEDLRIAEDNCFEALNRPYSPQEEARWVTLEGELRNCDDRDYLEWAAGAFNYDLGKELAVNLSVDETIPSDDGQMAFRI